MLMSLVPPVKFTTLCPAGLFLASVSATALKHSGMPGMAESWMASSSGSSPTALAAAFKTAERAAVLGVTRWISFLGLSRRMGSRF